MNKNWSWLNSSKAFLTASVLTVFAAVLLAGCGGGNDTASLQSIAVTPALPSIVKGVTKQFTATGTYSDGTSQNITASVTWTSSNAAIATVDAAGLASGFSIGSAAISATMDTVSGSTTITVTNAVPGTILQSIAVIPATTTVINGHATSFTAAGTYSDATISDITNQVTWVSANTNIATINSFTGVATGVAVGATTITASLDGITSLGVSITVQPLIGIRWNTTTSKEEFGSIDTTTGNFTVTGNVGDLSTWTGQSVLVGNSLYVEGKNSANQAKLYILDAVSGNLINSVNQVEQYYLVKIGNSSTTGGSAIQTGASLMTLALTPASTSVAVGGTQQFAISGTLSDGSAATLGNLTWTSSNPAVATISSSGLLTGVSTGSTNISISSGGVISNSAVVTVATATAPAFTSISGVSHTYFGITANGDLWGWGDNAHGQLGNGTNNVYGNSVAKLLGSGYLTVSPSWGGETYVHAVKADGTLMYWGSDIFNAGAPDVLTPQAIGTGFIQVASSTYSQAAIKGDGSLWVWGRNSSGLAGDGTYNPIAIPQQIGTGYSTVSVGTTHRLAVKQDGTLWGWGQGTCGALGPTAKNSSGGYTSFLVPTQIGIGYKDAVAFAAYSTIALKTDGSLWSWGQQNGGQLGDGVNTGCRDTPQQIGTGFSAIAGGYQYAIALKDDGSVWTWGHLSVSSLITGADSLVPQQVGTGFVKIHMGIWRAFAISADGGLWSWGDEYDSGFNSLPTYGYSAVPVKIK